jgi:hypothetical protein
MKALPDKELSPKTLLDRSAVVKEMLKHATQRAFDANSRI